MQISYQLTERDFVEAFRTHRNRSAFSKWSRRIFIAIIIVMGGVGLVVSLIDPAERRTTLLPLCGLLVFWVVILWLLPRWSIRRQFRKQPAAHGPRTARLDTDGAHWLWEGGSSDIAWENYIRWAEGPNQIILYISPACFGILPTRTLQPAQVAELREILKQSIPTAK